MQDMTKHPERMEIMLFTTMILLWSQPSCFTLYFLCFLVGIVESDGVVTCCHRPTSSTCFFTKPTDFADSFASSFATASCHQMQSLLEVCMRWFDMEDNTFFLVFLDTLASNGTCVSNEMSNPMLLHVVI